MIVEYKCTKCKHLFEIFHKDGRKKIACPKCGAEAKKQYSLFHTEKSRVQQ